MCQVGNPITIDDGTLSLASTPSPVPLGLQKLPRIRGMNAICSVLRQAEAKAFTSTIPIPHTKLAVAAETLGEDTMVMTSYQKFQNGDWGWFFSKNRKLDGSFEKPKSLTSFSQYGKLKNSVRRVIVDLAELDENLISEKSWEALDKAYDLWPEGYYAVYQTYKGDKKEWTCNIFVGEALYLAKMTLMKDKKYYGAKQIAKGAGGNLIEVPKEEVARGDIASMDGGHHVEIVTSVIKRDFFTDGFCSRGAGRDDGTLGKEKCDTIGGWTREIDESGTKFFRVR
jgi:hypothetical protein